MKYRDRHAVIRRLPFPIFKPAHSLSLLLKIKCKKIKGCTDKMIGNPSYKLVEYVFCTGMHFLIYRDAIVRHYTFKNIFGMPGKHRILYIKVKLNAGIGAYVINIV
jgi:hypothetical protein